MPCLRCDSIIPTGTGRQLNNGLMCRECLPDDRLDFMTHTGCTSIGNWNYVKDVSTVLGFRYRNILTDTLNPEDYENLQCYYIYPMHQVEHIRANALNHCEYLLIDSGCKIYHTHLTNCTVISRGTVEIINSNISSLYLSGSEPTLCIDNSTIGYVRGLTMQYNQFHLRLRHCAPVPGDMTELRVKSLSITSCDGIDYSIHNASRDIEVTINDSTIPVLHICKEVARLTLNGSTIGEYDTEGKITNTLDALHSSIAVYDTPFIVTHLVESTITQAVVTICPLCLRVIRGNSQTIKGTRVHVDCMRRSSYSYDNYKTVGNSTKLPPFGFELELRHGYSNPPQDYEEMIFDLIVHGFKRTSDSTVNDEMKSPIIRSDKWVLAIGDTLDNLAKSYIDDHCGTHIHVSCDGYVLGFLRSHKGMFEAMSEYMHEHEDNTIQLWGRFFNDNYAQMYIEPSERTSWINITGNHQTVEYRLPQLQSTKQFQRLLWFTRLLTVKLIQLSNDYDNGRIRYTYKMEREVLKFYQKFESVALKGDK